MIQRLASAGLLITFFSICACAQLLGSNQLADVLRGSSWSGHFGAMHLGGRIAIQFKNDLARDGSLQYMHKLEGGGVLGTTLGPFDKSCLYTPRTLSLTPTDDSQSLAGAIHVYKCAPTQAEENQRQANGRTDQPKTIRVKSVSLSPDGKTLSIVAKILGASVTYTLLKDPPSASATTSPTAPVPDDQAPAATSKKSVR